MKTNGSPIGVVVAVGDAHAEVSTSRSGACSGCSEVSSCGVGSSSDCAQIVTVRNPIGACPGDTVELDLPESAALRLSLLVWGVPLLGLVAGAVAGSRFGDAGAFVGAVAGAGGAVAVLHHIDRRLSACRQLTPYIARVVERAAPAGAGGAR